MADIYGFPQVSPAVTTGERGIATLYHPDVRTFRFRCNPKNFNWSYTLNKRVDQTYGGRVIQLLGTRIDDFTLKADSGGGGWPYLNKVALFARDVMIAQRNGVPATFEYTTRGWKFNAFITNVPFFDAVEEVLREFEIGMKVQEDVSGLISRNTLQSELRRLQDGIGFSRSKYNDPKFSQGLVPNPESYDLSADEITNSITNASQNVLNTLSFLPNNADIVSSILGATENGGG